MRSRRGRSMKRKGAHEARGALSPHEGVSLSHADRKLTGIRQQLRSVAGFKLVAVLTSSRYPLPLDRAVKLKGQGVFSIGSIQARSHPAEAGTANVPHQVSEPGTDDLLGFDARRHSCGTPQRLMKVKEVVSGEPLVERLRCVAGGIPATSAVPSSRPREPVRPPASSKGAGGQ